MIKTERLQSVEDFKELKKGDLVACSFKRDSYKGNKRTRFSTYEVVENKERTTEIILQVKNNIYFNYMMYLNEESNLKDIILIKEI